MKIISRPPRERVSSLEFRSAHKEDEVAFERASLSNALPSATLGYRAVLIVSIIWNPNENVLVEPREPLVSPRMRFLSISLSVLMHLYYLFMHKLTSIRFINNSDS